NKLQSIKTITETLNLEPFTNKWQSFGWAVQEVDGHNHEEIKHTFADIPFTSGKPNCIIAHTTKGQGVSFMQNSVLWHYRSAQGDEYENALQELNAQ
ncbi:MAG: transketolase, partial [Microcystaceae cyanobacterium]